MGVTRLETARSYVDARLFCTAHVLGTVHIHNQQAQATLPCTCPWHSAHPYSADTHSFARHTPSVDVAHTLRRRSLKLPHDQRPACKTHANSISTGRPMQLRTNRRGHSPAPSSVNPVKLRTNRRPHAPSPSSGSPVKLRINRRPHAPAPSSVSPVKPHTNPHQPPAPSCANPVKLRSKRHPICLSPGSCGNPVHLRTTRVGQATCDQCEEIRRVADGMPCHPIRECCSREY